ncbi:cell division protein ZapE [Photobacterium sp. 1_MG-2023]|uniref:cell division protein ZapE n=1 Tax=Photobacterium sp. 1_MG-2023 TaxID=3062646 RepID=UPI0026E1B5BA|nr:cell division protein ZapE [Photobacterium sp. 1_MG-2023]MDO6706424.1 cell division protein ZapE [Photobacterium sp. 1_MG-2023]
MTPEQRYQDDLKKPGFLPDAAQAMAVSHLEDLYHRMLAPQPAPEKPSFMDRLFKRQVQADVVPVRGLYFWGGVGRGKTYLVDTFFECLPTERKMRMHFHRFMHRVHKEMQTLSHQTDPLEIVADRFKQETDIICFDEFFVSDITDAMILGTLFQALFRRGITLVATSNIPPNDLYRNGLQRARFLPAIDLINTHCDVVNVDSGVDYRLRTLEQAEIYHWPLDGSAAENMHRYFLQLSMDPRREGGGILINDRPIATCHEADGVVHFTFDALCRGARSQADYMEIARMYHSVLLSGVPVLTEKDDDAARRFIAMVDEFYERHVKLIISAEVSMDQLYQSGRLSFEFKRCCSRLIEMQSHEYLARPHLA